MAMTDVSQKPRSRRSSARNSLERQIIFFICLMVFLPVTVVQRLVTALFRLETGEKKSIYAEAYEAASMCTRYAFMG